ncbi:MAG: type II secretion system F family protein, partial [Candidatus Sumerlaeia bacterium]|nr:type II secretion system F family protein [Candidatus Sumerlaeia bacterium]
PLERATVEVEKGKKLSTALAEVGIFPPSFVWAIQTSEDRGDLDFVLTELANLYDDKFDNLSQMVYGYLEPILIIFIGIFWGIVIYSFYQPLFTIPKILGKE